MEFAICSGMANIMSLSMEWNAFLKSMIVTKSRMASVAVRAVHDATQDVGSPDAASTSAKASLVFAKQLVDGPFDTIQKDTVVDFRRNWHQPDSPIVISHQLEIAPLRQWAD